MTVLFADGDGDARFAHHSIGTAEGFAVELAGDGFEAVALANVFVPDVVVLDVLLPGLDGFEVLRRLRWSPRTCDIPVVLVGRRGERFDEAVRQSGCDGHLVKPCSSEAILRLASVLAVRGRGPGPASCRRAR